MRSQRLSRPLVGLLLAAMMMSSAAATSVSAQSNDPDKSTAVALKTEALAPGVERILSDDAGHDLIAGHPAHPRDMDHIAIAPDGTVWIAGTASRSDNEKLRGYLVWAMGKPGIWGIDEGVPEDIQSLRVDADGTVWAIGSSIASFDGETWTTIGASPRRLGTPDGTLWLVLDEGGVEAWDGVTSTHYLQNKHINEIALAPDGSIWAVGHAGLDGGDGTVYRITHESDA